MLTSNHLQFIRSWTSISSHGNKSSNTYIHENQYQVTVIEAKKELWTLTVKIKLNALTTLLPFSILTHSPPLWSLVPSPYVVKKKIPLSWIFPFLLCNSLFCYVHFSLHLPISKCGIRLRADVASCSFSHHDHVTGHSQYKNHDSIAAMVW